ncbi:MAG: hypothetical protein IKE30_08040 [Clostridia bacterium]|nr:hypothetical protein [Clostridia bacterium]
MQKLNGMMLVRYYRILDMICMTFDDHVDTYNAEKEEYEDRFGIHAACWIRVVNSHRILASSEDKWVDENHDPIDESEKHAVSLFDQEMESAVKAIGHAAVEAIEVLPVGDIKMRFSNEILMELFANSCGHDDYYEDWRFMSHPDDIHISHSDNAFAVS